MFAEMANLIAALSPLACAAPIPTIHMPWKSNCVETASPQEEKKATCRIYDRTCWSERHGRLQTYETEQLCKVICFVLLLLPNLLMFCE